MSLEWSLRSRSWSWGLDIRPLLIKINLEQGSATCGSSAPVQWLPVSLTFYMEINILFLPSSLFQAYSDSYIVRQSKRAAYTQNLFYQVVINWMISS